MDNVNRILIVNVNWLGDVLFTTPLIKMIRRSFPSSFIACMVVPRCKEVLEDNAHIDHIIIYDEDGRHSGFFGKLRLIRELRAKHFDTAILLHRSFTRALVTFLSGIRTRIGYNTKNRALLLTKAIKQPPASTHKIEYFLNIGRSMGLDSEDKDYKFFVNDKERFNIEEFLKKSGINKKDKLVVLNPGGNWLPKRWPKERFAQLSDRLRKELKVKTVITGAPKDIHLGNDIVSLSEATPVNACGRTSIKKLGALMERADLVISSDSGPMHLALSVGSSVITLFGPTSDTVTGPYGSGNYIILRKDIGCDIPCYNFACRDYKCMKAITVDDVFKKAKEILTAPVIARSEATKQSKI